MEDEGRKRIPAPRTAKAIQSLPIVDDVATWIRAGYPATEVARRIKDQGYCEDMEVLTLAAQVRRYARNVMSPADVAMVHNPSLVLEARDKIQEGIDKIEALGELAQEFRVAILTAFGRLNFEPPEGYDPETMDFPVISDRRKPGVPQPRAIMGTDQWADVVKAADQMRKILVSMSEIEERMGVLGMDKEDGDAAREARLGEMIHRYWPGNQVMWDVLMDPRRRRKVLRAMELITNDRKMLDGIPDDDDE